MYELVDTFILLLYTFGKGDLSVIISHIKEIMDQQHKTIRGFAAETGLAINTVSGLYHDTSKRFDLETLNKLCKHLRVSTGDLIEYIEDEETPPE